jgi:hypothetical protein
MDLKTNEQMAHVTSFGGLGPSVTLTCFGFAKGLGDANEKMLKELEVFNLKKTRRQAKMTH